MRASLTHSMLSAGVTCGLRGRRRARVRQRCSRRVLFGRYYDSGTGQFLSVDPLVDVTGQPYAYTGDDPVNESDPSGLATLGVCGSINGVAEILNGGIQRPSNA